MAVAAFTSSRKPGRRQQPIIGEQSVIRQQPQQRVISQ
jgi:hypothetical protein